MAYYVIQYICFGIMLVQGMQPGPRAPQAVASESFARPTILSAMKSQLTSVYGNCSFPPSEVLTNVDSPSFDFLGTCNRRIPPLDTSDEGSIMCLGLLEVGLRLCSLDGKYFKDDLLFVIPNNSNSFNVLLESLNKQNDPNLCTDLKKVLDELGGNDFSIISKWNLQTIFQETEESCTRICFDYKNHARLLCKLILWASNLLVQPGAKEFESTIMNRAHAYQQNLSGVVLSPGQHLNQTNKNNTMLPTLAPDTSVNQDVDELQGRPSSMLGSSKPEDIIDAGIGSFPSSPNLPSSEIQQVNDAEDGHMEKVMPISIPGDLTETLNKSGVKQNSTKSIPDRKYQTASGGSPRVLDPEEVLGVKNTDNLPGHSSMPTANIKQEKSEGQEKSMSKSTISIEGGPGPSKPKDAIVDETSSASPVEKTLSDMGPRGDEFRDHYDTDTSLDQSQDIDDDVNFPPLESEQPAVVQEPTGYKTSYKYPQDEFANGNTFLQERFEDSEDSHFFSYFMAMVVLCIVGYVVFHNKQKIMALALEGRSRRTSRRRPASANYHKLDNNLEEAVSSPCSTSVTHVIY